MPFHTGVDFGVGGGQDGRPAPDCLGNVLHRQEGLVLGLSRGIAGRLVLPPDLLRIKFIIVHQRFAWQVRGNHLGGRI